MAVRSTPELLGQFQEFGNRRQQQQHQQRVSLQTVLARSDEHDKSICAFPMHTARLKTALQGIAHNPWQQGLKNRNKIFDGALAEQYINSAYPVIHERLMPLLVTFLNYKKTSGEEVERKYYKGKTVYDLVERLLKNRPITFVNPIDFYKLPGGQTGYDGFKNIGKEQSGLSLDDFMSYDEMRLSALVGVSSMSHFINKGDRKNWGAQGNGRDHEVEGVIIGQVGTRFERRGLMDGQDCIVTEQQNTLRNGYGEKSDASRATLLRAWAKLWEADFLPTEDEMGADYSEYCRRYCRVLYDGSNLDKDVYKKRIQMVAEVLLIEASSRAKQSGRRAYVHVVGLGLDLWMIDREQNSLYIDAWEDAIRRVSPSILDGISHIDFSLIKASSIAGVGSGSKFPGTNIEIVFSERNLHDPVPESCLLVCSYACDSNSSPGNEYWLGSLGESGDPAAASSSGVAELHNWRINPRVGAAHLRVASPSRGILTVGEWLQREDCVEHSTPDKGGSGARSGKPDNGEVVEHDALNLALQNIKLVH